MLLICDEYTTVAEGETLYPNVEKLMLGNFSSVNCGHV